MKLIKNIIGNFAVVGGYYVALMEPFSTSYVFLVKASSRELCGRHGGEHQFRCPITPLEEKTSKCLGVIMYEYNETPGDYNFKCLAAMCKKFRPASPDEKHKVRV